MRKLPISVAMCTYNGARFLPEQLESIAAQARLPDELVVCDDRSTDESVEIVKGFARDAPFSVRLEINEGNLGSTKNFEKAIGFCHGEIIALADQDDSWHAEKLRSIASVLENNERVGAVFSDAGLIDDDSLPLPGTLWSSFLFSSSEQKKFERGQGLKVLLKHATVTGATMAFRGGFRGLILPIPPKQVHDHWIVLLIASVSQIAPIRSPLVRYRRHPDQQIGPGADSLWQMIRLSTDAGRDGYFGEVERFNEICGRLVGRSEMFHPHPNALRLIRQKIRHRETRGRLPNSKFLRLPLLIREIATYRYWRYSNGIGSVAKDLLV
ncbi:MAG TPA: glycosyltransferase family 2 protein [Candidatus Solibacter sp.]|nr:glycosyltransferase family 2 protein [Candidatus Solibacter sp.]